MGKTNALRGKISGCQQQADESIPEAWECLQEYIRVCPHHGIRDWLLIQGFCHGLTNIARSHLDAVAGRAFFSLNVRESMELTEKMVLNEGWNDELLHPKKREMHTVNKVDIISAKMDLLMKKIEEISNFKKDHKAIQYYAAAQAIEADPWCEVCGGDDHSGNNCPEIKKDVNFINNNGYRSQQQQGWNSRPFYQGNGGNSFNNNQPSLRDLVLGKDRIN